MRSRRTLLILVAGLAMAGAVGVFVGTRANGDAARPRHLVIISVDTLRADRLGAYGYGRPTSPRIDALAASGVVFDDVLAASPWTKPSHASMYTGLYPTRHGAIDTVRRLDDDAVHLAEHLAAHGFHTAAAVNVRWLVSDGLERGFADFNAVEPNTDEREPSGVTQTAIAMLERRDPDRPLFAMIHYFDLHSAYASLRVHEQGFAGPYAGPADGTTAGLQDHMWGRARYGPADFAHLGDLYDASIRQIDAEIARLLDYLDDGGLLDETLVVLTSDHGEELGEHGGTLHGHQMWQEVLRVPLVVAGRGVPAGRRVAAPASHVDLMPTVLSLLEVPLPPGLDGIDLSPAWRGGALPPRLVYAEADSAFPRPDSSGPLPVGTQRVAHGGRYKLIRDVATGERRLFDLVADPGERDDLAPTDAARVEALDVQLRRHLSSPQVDTPAGTLTEKDIELLKSHGYLGGGD